MKITVYCGASMGTSSKYKEAAEKLGKWIADNDYELVYGGGKVGLMGVIANTVLENGGKAHGIMPDFLANRELAHISLTSLEIVEDMSIRKKKMIELGDVFIALPGGPGTLEEITEVISWSRIGKNPNPCILFNESGYYDFLEKMYSTMVEEGFLTKEDKEKILFSSDLVEIKEFIENYKKPEIRQYT